MNYKRKGIITYISEIKTLANGAKELTYRIDNGDSYNQLMEFQVYKKEEHAEHAENFLKYNKIGDNVEVEFSIRTFNWKPEADNKVFTSLSHWKLEKVDNSEATVVEVEQKDALPF